MKALQKLLSGGINFVRLPGGKLPERHLDGAGVDCYVRAIIDPTQNEPKNRHMRKTVATLRRRDSDLIPDEYRDLYAKHMRGMVGDISWALGHNEVAYLGLGFNVEIPRSFAGYINLRGSIAIQSITAEQFPIDYGFDGEPFIMIRNHGYNPFHIHAGMRICQLVIMPVWSGRVIEAKRIKHNGRRSRTNGTAGK